MLEQIPSLVRWTRDFLDGLQQKAGPVVGRVGILAGWIDIDSDDDIDAGGFETTCQPSGATREIYGLDSFGT